MTGGEVPNDTPLLLEIRGQVAWVTLNRAAARNVLSRDLVAAGRAALGAVGAAAGVRCVVITGAGDKAFCAGADLKERLTMDAAATRAFLDTLGGFCDGLAALPCPTIAAINGAAFGGGFEIALACDIRVAVDDAVMGLPEVKLGIIPGAGGTQRLARVCGVGIAKSLILTGRRIDAAEALRLGLVSSVVPRADLPDEIGRFTREICEAGPLAVGQAKRAIDDGAAHSLADALLIERACYEVVLASADRNEGLRAFAEKRVAKFTGK